MRVDEKSSTIVFDNLVQNPTSVGEKSQQTKIDMNVFRNENHKGDFPDINNVKDLEALYAKGLAVAESTLNLLK